MNKRTAMDEEPMWAPCPERGQAALLTSFLRAANARRKMSLGDYPALHRWSVDSPEAFWRTVCDFCGVVGEPGSTVIQDGTRMHDWSYWNEHIAELLIFFSGLRRAARTAE